MVAHNRLNLLVFNQTSSGLKGHREPLIITIQDSVRGATITSDSNNAMATKLNNPDGVVSLDPSGFTVGPGTGFNASNVTQ